MLYLIAAKPNMPYYSNAILVLATRNKEFAEYYLNIVTTETYPIIELTDEMLEDTSNYPFTTKNHILNYLDTCTCSISEPLSEYSELKVTVSMADGASRILRFLNCFEMISDHDTALTFIKEVDRLCRPYLTMGFTNNELSKLFKDTAKEICKNLDCEVL